MGYLTLGDLGQDEPKGIRAAMGMPTMPGTEVPSPSDPLPAIRAARSIEREVASKVPATAVPAEAPPTPIDWGQVARSVEQAVASKPQPAPSAQRAARLSTDDALAQFQQFQEAGLITPLQRGQMAQLLLQPERPTARPTVRSTDWMKWGAIGLAAVAVLGFVMGSADS